jgi:hypothetical protein
MFCAHCSSRGFESINVLESDIDRLRNPAWRVLEGFAEFVCTAKLYVRGWWNRGEYTFWKGNLISAASADLRSSKCTFCWIGRDVSKSLVAYFDGFAVITAGFLRVWSTLWVAFGCPWLKHIVALKLESACVSILESKLRYHSCHHWVFHELHDENWYYTFSVTQPGMLRIEII